MIRLIFLFSPVFTSLFLAISLAGDKKSYRTPRLFLSGFMLVAFMVFLSNFFYFAPFPDIFPYFEAPLAFSGLLSFPLYHIYFRLLTVDEKFSFKLHAKYLLPSAVITLVYIATISLVPWYQFKAWLYDENYPLTSFYFYFLTGMRQFIRFAFLVQLVLTLIWNYRLIRKYRHKAEQFYSDISDGKNRYIDVLNYSILVMSIISFAAEVLGRSLIQMKDLIVIVCWSGFSVTLYAMGYLGLKQKPVNPAFEPGADTTGVNQREQASAHDQHILLHKIREEFEKNKLYLNPELTIVDVAKAIGTNRTYISSVINQHLDQNFCSFVNTYRMKEMERILKADSKHTAQSIAEICGFGSANSLKRFIAARTGMTFTGYRRQVQLAGSSREAKTA